MSQQAEALKLRTMTFAISVLKMVERLPPGVGSSVIARQVAKSATSVGANYRAACSARSRRDFIAKLAIVVEEIEESVYWLDLIENASSAVKDELPALRDEARQLRAVFARSLGTARANSRVV